MATTIVSIDFKKILTCIAKGRQEIPLGNVEKSYLEQITYAAEHFNNKPFTPGDCRVCFIIQKLQDEYGEELIIPEETVRIQCNLAVMYSFHSFNDDQFSTEKLHPNSSMRIPYGAIMHATRLGNQLKHDP